MGPEIDSTYWKQKKTTDTDKTQQQQNFQFHSVFAQTTCVCLCVMPAANGSQELFSNRSDR